MKLGGKLSRSFHADNESVPATARAHAPTAAACRRSSEGSLAAATSGHSGHSDIAKMGPGIMHRDDVIPPWIPTSNVGRPNAPVSSNSSDCGDAQRGTPSIGKRARTRATWNLQCGPPRLPPHHRCRSPMRRRVWMRSVWIWSVWLLRVRSRRRTGRYRICWRRLIGRNRGWLLRRRAD